MKRILCLLFFVSIVINGFSQFKPFRFAFISDTHIGSPNGSAEEDLRRTVRDINSMTDIAFVVLTGDITELGTNEELQLAKQILDSLKVPWYIIPGNHDTGWSESGGAMFSTVFGYDKFSFEYNGIRFLGCASGPYLRMSDGHIPRDAVNWLDTELKKLTSDQPVIFLNHYPIDNGLDNWYEITDRLKLYNTWAILCGHGHANKAMNFEGIPGVMGRSNLRAKALSGGYNLVDVSKDSIIFSERNPVKETIKAWTNVKIETRKYDSNKNYPRPDYTINQKFKEPVLLWEYASDANVISTPTFYNDNIIFGNQKGEMICVEAKKNKLPKWKYTTGGAIFSSPAISKNNVVFGSSDGFIYCLDIRKGKLKWQYKTAAAVLGSPLIDNDTVYIGGSDHSFLALNASNGEVFWKYSELNGPVVSTPILYNNKVIFGAWDRNLYCLNKKTGSLEWKWNNGSSIRNYSPAACIPVAHNGIVFIVAPDRYVTAINIEDGKTLWRNNDATVRESIGISADGKWIYGKTMQDTIVAYAASNEKQFAAWKMNIGFGYEHAPSMLIEKDGNVFFGTKNGVVYSIDPLRKKINWAYKIDNSMVNTVRVINESRLLVSTMDGKIVLLKSN